MHYNIWKQLLIFSLLCGMITKSIGQKFSAPSGRIHDFEEKIRIDTFKIEVFGLQQKSNKKRVGLNQVCINVLHNRTTDLKISLVNPLGVSIWLTNRNGGGSGINYTSTCFTRSGFFGYIHQNENPFNGTFIPDGKFDELNKSGSPNGTWLLLVEDLAEGVSGMLTNVELSFGELNFKPLKKACTFENPKHCKCEKGKSTGDLLPDIVVLPTFTERQIFEFGEEPVHYRKQLHIAVSLANIGNGPMEIKGDGRWYCDGSSIGVDSMTICGNGKYARQHIIQKVYYKPKRKKISHKEVTTGTNYYDARPGHTHFHVDDWVEFRLLKELETGGLDTISTGQKVSYCLFDSGTCNDQDDICKLGGKRYGIGNLPNYGLGNYLNCYSDFQGISVGGYDTYGMFYEGQYLQLPEDITNGDYILEVVFDPKNLFVESNKSNNSLRFPVQLIKQ